MGQPANKKPPAAFAGGGLCCCSLPSFVRQASLPARVLEPLIRMAGGIIALGTNVCMTLM
jgi:hypothetical protein